LNRQNASIPSIGVEAFPCWGHRGGTNPADLRATRRTWRSARSA